MYKEPSSSASRKRKAEDSVNADGSEEDDRPKQGHTSKKIKASNGYGPGPGALGHIKRDSRGTVTMLSNNQIMLCLAEQHYVDANIQGSFQLSFPEKEG